MNEKYLKQETRYKYEVEKDGDYEYIRSYRKGEELPNGRIVGDSPYLQVKHKYCGNIYEVNASGFINNNKRCPHCCKTYENSFAYHIEVELGEPLEKYWDFEKNTMNPYHISKNSHNKVWIKCQEKDYHGSYEIICYSFISNQRCSYCCSRNIHPKDSFAQYHIDNTDKDFLTKYWSNKNAIDPFKISPNSNKNKIWILCQEKYYHNDDGGYTTYAHMFTQGSRCSYCEPNGCKSKVHPLDSFGVKYPDKAKCWHEDNDKSPYEIAPSSGKKYKFICDECGYVWLASINKISQGCWCPKCAYSKGEKRVEKWLKESSVKYESQKTYDGLIGVGGGLLSYDFYLPNHNLLIEYQGRQHEEYIEGFHKSYEDFEKQLEHDRRKKQYAVDNDIKLLEIWYYDYDNIEKMLKKWLTSYSIGVIM